MPLLLHEISDPLEIQEVLTRYCYAVEDRDWDTYGSAFTLDAIIDETAAGGLRGGVDEHVAFYEEGAFKDQDFSACDFNNIARYRGRWGPRANPLFVPDGTRLRQRQGAYLLSRIMVSRPTCAHPPGVETQGADRGCGFRCKPNTYSSNSRTPIPVIPEDSFH
jgi:hypothetical protein